MPTSVCHEASDMKRRLLINCLIIHKAASMRAVYYSDLHKAVTVSAFGDASREDRPIDYLDSGKSMG